jgi:cardiolipin synthase
MNHEGRDRPDTAEHWQLRLHTLLGTPATTGNEIRVLRNGVEIFPAMLGAIEAAERTVDLVTFVYWRGDIAHRFADTLAAAARRGCRVRVLLDAVGARKLDPELVAEMEAAGCDVRWFRPVGNSVPDIGELDHRTHRKILVCDSAVGFTGGVGIADEWDGDARDETEWRDTHLAIRGPAVAGLVAGFIDNWADQDDDGFDPAAEPVASELWRLMLGLTTCAQHRVRIATAYFNPDDRLCVALSDAVARGVDVSMMHAKVITVDGVVATVDSANMNQRSTQFDEETNALIFDPDVVAVLDRHLDDDHEHSTLIDPADWAERGLLQRAAEKATGIVGSLL